MRCEAVSNQSSDRGLRAITPGAAEQTGVEAPFPLRVGRCCKPEHRPTPGCKSKPGQTQENEQKYCTSHSFSSVVRGYTRMRSLCARTNEAGSRFLERRWHRVEQEAEGRDWFERLVPHPLAQVASSLSGKELRGRHGSAERAERLQRVRRHL